MGRVSQQEAAILLQTQNSMASLKKVPALKTSCAAETSLLTMALAADAMGQQQQQLLMTAGHAALVAPPGGGGGGSTLLKDIQGCLVLVLQQYIAQYGPVVILLDNLHDFDSWSWQLLIKAVDVALVIGARRPGSKRRETEKRQALAQRMADTAIGQLLRLDSTLHIRLQPFSLEQTRQLMQVMSLGYVVL
jgi:predicted ATPase